MKKLTSVFTENMDCCIYTGSYIVERHQGVFPNDGQKQVEGIVNWIKVDAKNPRIEITIYEDGDKY